ncbi:toxin Cry1Ac domain D-VI-related protein [Paenibacillus sp. HWE-109]|uniref:toxin Cry1Ac domain D-VI-related protein n=1 Tax=Paenibacillus sp. HWE-109 TaxID=1306526 RepID=UPI001EE02650|nr:toxin Cry1Ac domain D-VI-related protein [Paenibacillus sp. HWE-109]UKS24177.1 toxin Cry1Ac domain D-VI-related protein [Paenibacillus sp. HWE-109]
MKKTAIISIVALLLVAGISGLVIWKINDDKAKKEMDILTDISTIQEKVNSLYKDNHKMNLVDNVNTDMIKSTNDLFINIKNKELSPQASTLLNQASLDISYVEKMFYIKQNIDKLFDKNGAIVESADIKSSKDQLDTLKSDKPYFVNELMTKINDAETQKEQISTATRMVDALFTSSEKSTVKESITRKEIDDAKVKTINIKQDKAKESLLSFIQVTDAHVDSKIKAEAEAKAKAEAEAKAEADSKAKAVADANKSKNKNSSQASSPAKKSDGTLDLTGWVQYSTGDPASLLKYLASGDVIKYNGQYWASPQLVKMISNEEVVYFNDISKK